MGNECSKLFGNESSKPSSSSKDEPTPQPQQPGRRIQIQIIGTTNKGKVNQAEEKLDAYIQSGKREHLSLTVPKFLDECAKEEFQCLSEGVVQVAGTEWKLIAAKSKDTTPGVVFLSLAANSTLGCNVRFEVDYSFRLANAADPSKDIRKVGQRKYLNLTTLTETGGNYEHLVVHEIEPKDLADLVEGGFVRADGSIHMELDFSIKSAFPYSGKREHLSLIVAKYECAKEEFFCLSEDVVRAAGAEWKLIARKCPVLADRLLLYLVCRSEWKCTVHHELDYFFRLSNAAPSKDDCCAGKANFSVETGRRGYLLIREIEFEDLEDPSGGFVLEGGSIHMELDFTILKATIEGLPDEQEGASSSSSKK